MARRDFETAEKALDFAGTRMATNAGRRLVDMNAEELEQLRKRRSWILLIYTKAWAENGMANADREFPDTQSFRAFAENPPRDTRLQGFYCYQLTH